MGSLGTEIQGVEQDDLVMPVIDFGAFLHGSESTKTEIATQVAHAFQTSGFLYLSNHGIAQSDIDGAFARSAKFFARPQAQKDALAWTTPSANRGYVAYGREKVTQVMDPEEVAKLRSSNPDMKESIEIGRDNNPDHANRWPDTFDDDGKDFKAYMTSFHSQLQRLHAQVMRSIAVGMLGGLANEAFFDRYTDDGENNLRLLHYPAVLKSVFRDNPDQVRAGEHSDYGSITLLIQDDVGGLEVKSPRGTWVRARPIPGTIVVNAGDLLMRWSNDTIKSTMHRVIQPPDPVADPDPDAMYPERYSIAYFCNPNYDRLIEALPGTWEKSGRKYESVNSGEYLISRLSATY